MCLETKSPNSRLVTGITQTRQMAKPSLLQCYDCQVDLRLCCLIHEPGIIDISRPRHRQYGQAGKPGSPLRHFSRRAGITSPHFDISHAVAAANQRRISIEPTVLHHFRA